MEERVIIIKKKLLAQNYFNCVIWATVIVDKTRFCRSMLISHVFLALGFIPDVNMM